MVHCILEISKFPKFSQKIQKFLIVILPFYFSDMPLNLSLKPAPSATGSPQQGPLPPTTMMLSNHGVLSHHRYHHQNYHHNNSSSSSSSSPTTKLSIDLPHNPQASPGIWSPASVLEEEEQRRRLHNYILTSHLLNAQQQSQNTSTSPILQNSLQQITLPGGTITKDNVHGITVTNLKKEHPLMDALISTSGQSNGAGGMLDPHHLLAESASSSASSPTATNVKKKGTKKSGNSPRTFQVCKNDLKLSEIIEFCANFWKFDPCSVTSVGKRSKDRAPCRRIFSSTRTPALFPVHTVENAFTKRAT